MSAEKIINEFSGFPALAGGFLHINDTENR